MKKMNLNIQLFGHTNETDNYDLPQFVGSDKPTWLGDFNEAMSAIDAGIAENASDISSLDTRVTSAEGTASQASTDVASLQSTVSTLSSSVTSVTTTANNAQSTATSALNTANTADGKADTANTNIGTLSNLNTTAKTNLVSAINEVNTRNIMCISLENTYTVPTSNTLVSITGYKVHNSTGSKLTLSSNKIVIGAGVSKVLVSYSSEVKAAGGASTVNTYLAINNTLYTQEGVKLGANESGELSCTPVLFDVNEGDTISLSTYTVANNQFLGIGDGRAGTFITVEVVA